MSSQDALWLNMDRPNNLMVIDSLMWFDSPLDLDAVREVLTTRLIDRFDVFSARPVRSGGDLDWEADPDFDLSRHLRVVELGAPGDFDELRDWVGSQRSEVFDRAHPLWSATVVQGFHPTPDAEGSAMLLRTHHSLADGVRLTQVMFSMCDTEGDPVVVGTQLRKSTTPVDVAKSAAANVAKSAVDVAGTTLRTAGQVAAAPVKGAARLVTDPAGLAADAASSTKGAVDRATAMVRNPARVTDAADLISSEDNRPVNDVASTAKLLLAPPSVDTVWSGTPGVAKSVGWATDLPLADVKKVGKATGTTVNDVLLGTVSGALTRYLRDHGDEDIDEVMWMVPVSVRPFDPTETDELGNHFALVALRMPLGIDDIPERLAEIHHRMDRIKSSDEALITFGVQRLISSSPTPVATGLTNYFANKAVGVLTNVPGPRGPISFAGTRVAGSLGWAPCSGDQVMTICIFSYNNRVSVGFGTDAELIPDADKLGPLFVAEFDAMVAAVEEPQSQS